MDLIDRDELLRHLDKEIRTAPNSIALNEAVEIRGYVKRMPKVDTDKWLKVTTTLTGLLLDIAVICVLATRKEK